VAPASDQDRLVDAGPMLPPTYEYVAVFLCAGLFLEGLFSKKRRATGE
jgi:hypothetical protein